MKLRAGGARIVTTGEGNGPVNALDHALRQAIQQLYPEIVKFELIDYKVRILDQGHGTDAITRVLIETSDGESSWVTVGVGHNVILRPPGWPCSTASPSGCAATTRSGQESFSRGAGSIASLRPPPWRRTSKCRWQPSGAPLSEESAIRWPGWTGSPGRTKTCRVCPMSTSTEPALDAGRRMDARTPLRATRATTGRPPSPRHARSTAACRTASPRRCRGGSPRPAGAARVVVVVGRGGAAVADHHPVPPRRTTATGVPGRVSADVEPPARVGLVAGCDGGLGDRSGCPGRTRRCCLRRRGRRRWSRLARVGAARQPVAHRTQRGGATPGAI